MIKIKMRVDSYIGEHVRVTFFGGMENFTMHNMGTLVMSPAEYQNVGAALSLAAVAMRPNLLVEHEIEAFREEDARRNNPEGKRFWNAEATPTELARMYAGNISRRGGWDGGSDE